MTSAKYYFGHTDCNFNSVSELKFYEYQLGI